MAAWQPPTRSPCAAGRPSRQPGIGEMTVPAANRPVDLYVMVQRRPCLARTVVAVLAAVPTTLGTVFFCGVGRLAGGCVVVGAARVVVGGAGIAGAEVGMATVGWSSCAGADGLEAAAIQALPAPTLARPRASPAVALLVIPKRGSGPRTRAMPPSAAAVRPATISSTGSSATNSRTRRILAHAGSLRNRTQTGWRGSLERLKLGRGWPPLGCGAQLGLSSGGLGGCGAIGVR